MTGSPSSEPRSSSCCKCSAMMKKILMMTPVHWTRIIQLGTEAVLLQHYWTTPSKAARVDQVRLHVAGVAVPLDVMAVAASTQARLMTLTARTCQFRDKVRQHSESKVS
jgi:hypothetical protein